MAFDELHEPEPMTIAVDHLRPSPRNRRARIDPEFVASIAEHGVLERLVVRPLSGGGHEIVCGHRRWMGAKEAGLATVPVDVVALDDRAAMEVAIVENLHRESLTPLEEADAFRWLIEEQGRSVGDVAARVHRSESYVRQRLHLHGLDEDIREALAEDRIAMDAALLVAQTPESVQERIAHRIEQHRTAWHPGGVIPRLARNDVTNWLQDHWQELREAPFDTSDASLVETAGACGSCPKRTGTQGVLFDVVEVADACLDEVCWAGKAEAGWARRVEDAGKRGLRVLSDEEMEKIAPWGRLDIGSAWVDLHARPVDLPGDDRRSWADLVGDDVPRAVGRNEQGKVFELAEKKAALRSVAELARESGDEGATAAVQRTEKVSASMADGNKRDAAEERRRKESEKKEREAKEEEVPRIVAAAVEAWLAADVLTRPLRGLITLLALYAPWADVLAKFVAMRKIDADDGYGEKLDHPDAIIRWASSADDPDLFGALFELVQRSADVKGDDRATVRSVLTVLPAGIVKRAGRAGKGEAAAKPPKAAKPKKAIKGAAKPAPKKPAKAKAAPKAPKKPAKKGAKK